MRIPRMFQLALILRHAGRSIAAGQEIRISYGPLSDGELLLTYGFVEGLEAPAVNPNNKAVLAESDVCDAAKVCLRSWRALGWHFPRHASDHDGQNEKASQDLHAFI